MAKLRVLFVTGEYPPMRGGIADYTHALSQHLDKLSIETEVLTSAACQSPEMRVHPVVGRWNIAFWSIAKRIITERKIDIVHIQYQTAAFSLSPSINFFPWYLRRQPERPAIVTTFHDLRTPYFFPKAGPLRGWVNRKLGHQSDALIFVTAEDRARWAASGQPQEKMFHIGVGPAIPVVPSSAAQSAALRREWGVAPASFLVGFFGFINLTKGLDTLCLALRSLRDQGVNAQLVIIGGDLGDSDPYNAVYKRHLERMIQELHLDAEDAVLTTGYLEAEAASQALSACDVLALPFTDGASLRRTSLLTALAHGLPVVTTHPKQPIKELQESSAALFVPPEDPAALAEALFRLHQDSGLRQELGKHARTFARQFSWDVIAQHTVAVYQYAQGKRSNRHDSAL